MLLRVEENGGATVSVENEHVRRINKRPKGTHTRVDNDNSG